MSRRRPTQIIPPRPDATGASRVTATAQPGALPPDFAALSATWVREICPTDADHRAEARKRWRVATGQDSGNPEQTAGRSKVQRIQPDANSPAQWHKAYQHGFGVYESHELLVLVQLWSAPAQNQRSPRDYHAQAVLLGQDDGAAQGPKEPSRLQRLVTKDAGPNLLSWEYFAPLTQVGPQQLAWPLFAHPLYLAAMTHRLLVALEVLFEHKVVHLDLKPENVGLALPDSLRLDPATGQAHGSLRLKALPLKLLDFEFSVHHALSYPNQGPPSNDYTSPFAIQRLTLAAAHATQSNAWAQAVDWGADLYALGCMLEDWAAWACGFADAYRQKLRNEVGPQNYDLCGLAVYCDTWAEDLAWLVRFAQTLKAQDRPADEALAGQFDLPARPSTPLAGLRLQLAQRFPALQDGARELELPFSLGLPPGAVTPEPKPEPEIKRTAPSKISRRVAGALVGLVVAVPAAVWVLPHALSPQVEQPTANMVTGGKSAESPTTGMVTGGEKVGSPASGMATGGQEVGNPAAGAVIGGEPPAQNSPQASVQPWRDLQELTVPGCGSDCPSFIVIPDVGPVTLGSGDEALPIHIRHRYAMGKTEVTVGEWKAFWNAPDRNYQSVKTESTHCNWNDKDVPSNDRQPVACVNVADADAYVRWINQRYGRQMGVTFDLPTEVEWELAARGGRYTQDYLWADGAGKEDKCRHAQISDCPGGTLAVGSRKKNGYGLYDMVGNVWEWQASPWRDKRSELSENGLEPKAAGVSVSRTVRGASVYGVDDGLRLVDRNREFSGNREYQIGFRLVARIASR